MKSSDKLLKYLMLLQALLVSEVKTEMLKNHIDLNNKYFITWVIVIDND